MATLSGVSMAASELEVAVFIDTDMGTRFAIAVPPHATTEALKREVERVHLNCFPELGEIKVNGFMVKQKSKLYHLSETWRVEGVQSLHVKVRPLNEFNKPCLPTTNNSTDCLEKRGYSTSTNENKIRVDGKRRSRKRFRRKECLSCRSFLAWTIRRKKKRIKRNQLLQCTEKKFDMEDLINDAENPDVSTDKRKLSSVSQLVEAPSELSSEVLSVSGIMKRYFPNFDEVSSIARGTPSQPEEFLKKKMACNNVSPQFSTKKAQNLLPFPLPSNAGSQKPERSKLGKRLVKASYTLGISPGKERPEISLCNSKGRKFQEFMSSLPKSSCFEISDSED